jgi:hypothetical protein
MPWSSSHGFFSLRIGINVWNAMTGGALVDMALPAASIGACQARSESDPSHGQGCRSDPTRVHRLCKAGGMGESRHHSARCQRFCDLVVAFSDVPAAGRWTRAHAGAEGSLRASAPTHKPEEAPRERYRRIKAFFDASVKPGHCRGNR